MKDLIIDVRMINSSGIGTYIKNTIPYIEKEIDCLLVGDEKKIKKFLPTYKGEVLNNKSKIYTIKEQFYFSRLPEACIYWSPHFNVPLFPIKAKHRVTTICDVYHLANKKEIGFFHWLYAKVLIEKAIKSSSRILTISNFSKSEIVKYTSAKQEDIEIIKLGVNKEKFLNTEKNIYNIIDSDKYILYVGNVKPHKNLGKLLEAYNLLPIEVQKKHKLVILGKKDGFLNGDLRVKEISKTNKNIRFTGYVEDEFLGAIYHNASMFVFPSLYEGFGLPPLEAMVAKTPVLASNIEVLKELLGDSCLYFDPHNAEDMKVKILETLKNQELRSKLISKGSHRVNLYNWEETGKQHIEIFKKFLKK